MKIRTLFGATLLTLAVLTAKAQQPSAPMPPLVTVSGTGEIKVSPDEIMLNLAVENRAKTLDEARKENDNRVAAVLAYLKKYGVDPKHVQTAYINVQPAYQHDFGQTTPEFYTAQKTIAVLVKKPEKFDDLLTGIYKAGVNRVDGIELRTSELKKYRDQARKLAIQAAREKATLLTTELGAKVGRVYAINENTGPGYPVPYRAMANKMSESMAMDAGGPTISVGQIVVTSTVEASFLIE